MNRISVMIVLLLSLTGCAYYTQSNGRVVFISEDGALKVESFEGPIAYGAFAVLADSVVSPYCHAACLPQEGGYIYLSLPEKAWPHTVELGMASNPVGGKASVVLQGTKGALETELAIKE